MTCFQVVVFFYVKNTTTKESKAVISLDVKKSLLIKDVDNYMIGLKNYIITNRVKDGDGWIISVKLIGAKEDIIYDLNSLDKFIVKSYNINFKNDKYEVELDIKSK
ncbi:MAG: hypothetical protein ACRC68_12140 [Clostridium sp.]